MADEQKKFENGVKPSVTDFKVVKIEKVKKVVDGEETEEENLIEEDVTVLPGTDVKGRAIRYVLLSNGSIATVREGKGSDVEKAALESGNNQAKYMSSMMASTTTIEDKAVNMWTLADMNSKDYLRIQSAFVEINF